MKTPLAAICVLFIAGIMTAENVSLPSKLIIPVVAVFLVASLYVTHRKKMHGTMLAFTTVAWFFAGFVAAQDFSFRKGCHDGVESIIPLENHESRVCTLEGYIVDNPRVMENKIRFTLQAAFRAEENRRLPMEHKIAVTARNCRAELCYGDYVHITARLKRPRNFHNPGGFDYVKHLKHRGIHYTASTYRPSDILVLRRGYGNPFSAFIESRRNNIRELIEQASPSPQSEVLGALILGESYRISPTVREQFAKAGLAHVLAISGFHIGMAAFFTFLAVKLVMCCRTSLLLKGDLFRISAFLTIPVVCYYAFIAGFGTPTQRATLMIVAFVSALILSRTGNLLNTLFLAAIIILSLSPGSLYQISFQLSFTAVAAIAITLPRLRRLQETSKRGYLARKMIVFFTVTAVSAAATAPLVAYYFNRLSTVVLLSNALVVPPVGFGVLPLSMAAAFSASLVPGFSLVMLKAASLLLTPILFTVARLEEIPGSSIGLTTPSLVEIICFYTGFLLILKLTDNLRQNDGGKDGKRRIMITAASLVIVTAVGIGYGRYLDRQAIPVDRLEMTCLDVGQGSSVVITFPDRTVIVVDGGGFHDPAFDTGKNIVAPYLRYRRIKEIDILVLTHPDQDHIGGLPYLLETFKVKEVWTNGDGTDTPTYRHFARLIEKKDIPHHVLWSGSNARRVGDVTISFISPSSNSRKNDISSGRYDFNRHSLVFSITWGGIRFLLPADITGEKEKELLASGVQLRSDVMVAPHHGSHTSNTMEFLEAVRPRVTVASLGFGNPFGFPAPEVVERYNNVGAKLYRTDIHGAVTISTDKKNIEVTCFLPCEQ